jgi:hypothetical protein
VATAEAPAAQKRSAAAQTYYAVAKQVLLMFLCNVQACGPLRAVIAAAAVPTAAVAAAAVLQVALV